MPNIIEVLKIRITRTTGVQQVDEDEPTQNAHKKEKELVLCHLVGQRVSDFFL
jgi:hypothetical protein